MSLMFKFLKFVLTFFSLLSYFPPLALVRTSLTSLLSTKRLECLRVCVCVCERERDRETGFWAMDI